MPERHHTTLNSYAGVLSQLVARTPLFAAGGSATTLVSSFFPQWGNKHRRTTKTFTNCSPEARDCRVKMMDNHRLYRTLSPTGAGCECEFSFHCLVALVPTAHHPLNLTAADNVAISINHLLTFASCLAEPRACLAAASGLKV